MLTEASALPRDLARIVAWRRVRFTLIAALPFGLMLSAAHHQSTTPMLVWVIRAMTVALCAMLAYGVFEQWPARLPAWLARWVLQLLGVVAAVPLGALLAYWLTTGGAPQFSQNPQRVTGYLHLLFVGVLFAPWMALGAMVRQREAVDLLIGHVFDGHALLGSELGTPEDAVVA